MQSPDLVVYEPAIKRWKEMNVMLIHSVVCVQNYFIFLCNSTCKILCVHIINYVLWFIIKKKRENNKIFIKSIKMTTTTAFNDHFWSFVMRFDMVWYTQSPPTLALKAPVVCNKVLSSVTPFSQLCIIHNETLN